MAKHVLTQPPPLPTDGGAELLAWACRTRESTPVAQDENGLVWHVFRYEHVRRVLTDHTTFSSDLSALNPVEIFQVGNMLRMDPPQHQKYRKLINKAFTPRTVADLEPRIVEITHSLLDAADGRDELDLVDALSYPLPVTVIAELLGVPEQDAGLFKSWVDNLFNRTIDNPFDPATADAMTAAVAPLRDYLAEHVRDRRAHPRDDLITSLVQADVDGDRLTDEEAVTFAGVLLLAGHVTTTLLLGNAVRCLHDNPAVVDDLRDDRGGLTYAIEEMLRVRPPFSAIARMTTTDVEIDGVTIPANRPVLGSLLGANYDPRQFPDPDSFRPERFRPGQHQHLTFGHGVHYCVGVPLARLEARVVLDIMLSRYKEIRVDETRPAQYYSNQRFNGPKSLPIVLRG